MDYQVWTKEEYGENYTLTVCGDLPAVRRELDKAVRAGKEPMLTIEVPYEHNIRIGEAGSVPPKKKLEKTPPGKIEKEVSESETKEGKAQSDKVAGDKGNSEVRRGDEEVTS